MFIFETFLVYQKAEAIYSELLLILPSLKDKVLLDQLRRAMTSIVLNIAEGSGKFSPKEKKNYYLISRASVSECVAILRLLHLQAVISEQQLTLWKEAFLVIHKMLSGMIKTFSQSKRDT
jgi:four helix bundle protein